MSHKEFVIVRLSRTLLKSNPILISIRMVNELFLLLLRNFGITYLRILSLQTQLMILNANLEHFILRELMNRDVLIVSV